MSLYGNVKKVNSSVFQFDKIYSSRVDLEDNIETDGVYIGRYVLIEYGERWTSVDNEPVINESVETYTNSKGVIVRERSEYRQNADKDLIRFGAIYDSTVWQKIYSQGHDKYIMIAELNALAPKLDMQQHSPITFVRQGESNEDEGILAGNFNEDTKELEVVKLINAKERYNDGYFDNEMENEISYLLHYPKMLQLNAGDNTVNYNEKAFNPVYSYGEVDGPSTIALIPEIKDNYVILKENDQITPQKDHNGNYLAELTKNVDIDQKKLFINFPVFGNSINTIYDLIYGIPEVGAGQKLKNGILRPYFKQFLRNINFKNKVVVKNNEGNYEPLLIDGEPQIVEGTLEFYSTVTNSWEPVVKYFSYNREDIITKTISPNFIEVKFKDNNNDTLYDINDERIINNNLQGRYILYNTLTLEEVSWTMQMPTGEDNQIAGELDNVPILTDLSKINAVGLASILQDLFGVKDPITGIARYFLYNDWTADSNGEDNTPMIVNKPYVIGGYEENLSYTEQRLKTFDAYGQEIPGGELQYYMLHTNTSDEFSGGNYKIDFNTWQLIPTVVTN